MTTPSWRDDPTHGLRIATADGEFDAYLARPDSAPRPAVVVLHEVFGGTSEEVARDLLLGTS